MLYPGRREAKIRDRIGRLRWAATRASLAAYLCVVAGVPAGAQAPVWETIVALLDRDGVPLSSDPCVFNLSHYRCQFRVNGKERSGPWVQCAFGEGPAHIEAKCDLVAGERERLLLTSETFTLNRVRQRTEIRRLAVDRDRGSNLFPPVARTYRPTRLHLALRQFPSR